MKSILDKMGITPNAMQQDEMHALLWLHQEENLPCSRLQFSRIWEVVCVPWLAMEAE